MARLKFKGDKKTRKRKREHIDDDDRNRLDDTPDDTWVLPDNAQEIRGPTFIVHPHDGPAPVAVTFSSAANRVLLQSLDKEDGRVMDRIPSDVAQVWVTTRVAGSPTINLRTGTGEGKFLSSDTHGIVSSDATARSMQEQWTPVLLPDSMVAFQNVYEKYLSIDEVAGGQLVLRADSDDVGFKERFWVKIQNKYKKEAHEEEKKRTQGEPPRKLDEKESNHIYQAWGMGRSVVSSADRKELKRAKKEGRLAEAMLDRRAKLKSDRFC